MKLFLTGASGFIGSHVIRAFKKSFDIEAYQRGTPLDIRADAVLHLAGVAHDLRGGIEPEAYFTGNTALTKAVFTAFLNSPAKTFIFMSSVKAAADQVDGVLREIDRPLPLTIYGQSKLRAEQWIQALGSEHFDTKRVYILRPCLVHGSGNKGNLELLVRMVSRGIPWPLGAFQNERSFCSIDNLLFVLNELLRRTDIPSGIYQVADDTAISTEELIRLIARVNHTTPKIWNIPKPLLYAAAHTGDMLNLPLNTERLQKLTENYVVSNRKLVAALQKPLPLSAEEGLLKTIQSFRTRV